MSLLSALSGDTKRTSVRSVNSPPSALRTKRSMQIRNAASVFPEPVGAEISVVCRARIDGQPSCCGSVGVPKRLTNQSRTSGCAHSKPAEIAREVSVFIANATLYLECFWARRWRGYFSPDLFLHIREGRQMVTPARTRRSCKAMGLTGDLLRRKPTCVRAHVHSQLSPWSHCPDR